MKMEDVSKESVAVTVDGDASDADYHSMLTPDPPRCNHSHCPFSSLIPASRLFSYISFSSLIPASLLL